MKDCVKSVLVIALAASAFGGSAVRAGWVPDGVAVCTAASGQYNHRIVPDGLGGAIIVWQDLRSGTDNIYAQRIAADGSIVWHTDGVALCLAAGSQQRPGAVPDGFGGAIVAWEDHRSPADAADIYAQRIDAMGVPQWQHNGVPVCTASGGQQYPMLVSDGAGGAVIGWNDSRGGSIVIYLQRIDASGAAFWNLDGFPLYPYGGTTGDRQIISDGPGGAIVTWIVGQNVYAQKIAPNSARLWTESAALVCAASGGKHNPTIVSDGSGGAVIAWGDARDGGEDIYAQRLGPGGAPQWAVNGVAVFTGGLEYDVKHPALVAEGTGSTVVIWMEHSVSGLANDKIFAQRLDAGGSSLWDSDIWIGTADVVLGDPDAASDRAGGAIVTWMGYIDEGNPEEPIFRGYVQRIDAAGSLRWTPGGVPLCSEASQAEPAIVSDGAGGAIIAWGDTRGAAMDIYAQRFDEDGVVPIATLLRAFAVAVERGLPTITWTLSSIDPDAEPFVERAETEAGPYAARPADLIARSALSFVFVDEGCEAGASYWYRVGAILEGEKSMLFETGPVAIPAAPLALMQNHPNPFNPATTILYSTPRAGAVTLEVYDSSGRFVTALLDRAYVAAGTHSVRWSGADNEGRPVSSGVYFCRLRSGKDTASRRMVLIR